MDASRLTGEPVPVSAHPGIRLLSGSLNLEGPLTVRVTAPASESQYARIVELVRTAQESKLPLQRLADRYAVWFTPLTLAVCAATYLLSGDATRVLAIFRHGTALDQLGRVEVAIFDKTGTLTIGRPKVARVLPAADLAEEEVLRLAGSVDSRRRPNLTPVITLSITNRDQALSERIPD